MSFWGELKRRNVVKVGVAYVVVAWLLIQVATSVLPTFEAPGWVARTITFVLFLGFPILLIFAWAFEITPEGIKKTQHVPLEESITHVTSQKLNYVVIGLLALALGFVIVDQYILEAGVDNTATPAAGTAATADETSQRVVLPNSVAVLPLDNLSPISDNAYIAAGLHEEILNQLAKLRNLNVIARTSVLRFSENRPPIEEIARMLNVQSIMEGSVRYAGNRIRVTTQLIDSATGAHLWSETYDREFDDIFAIESDIAMNVANALEAEFSDEEQERIERPPTNSARAYGLLLQVNDLAVQGNQAPRMLALLDQAIEIDPNFAIAHARKASIYAAGVINTTVGAARAWAELAPLARESAELALAIDPDETTALGALGNLANYSWHWTEAREAYNRASSLGNLAPGTSLWLLAWSGNEAEALRIGQRVVELNPLNWGAHWIYGIVLNYARDYDGAAATLRNGIELAGPVSLPHSSLAWTEIARGNLDVARRELELTEQLLGENRVIISLLDIAYGYGRIGDADNARRLFDEVSALTEQGQEIGTGGWALLHLAVGDNDAALAQLRIGSEKASRNEPDAGYFSLMNIRMNATADPVLEQPEFVEVRSRLRGN